MKLNKMKLTIPKQDGTSITEEIILELGNYTILAGENNSGKTSLVKAIMDHEAMGEYEPIFIPAENTQPQNEETKTSATTTDFFKLLKLILGPIFDKSMLKDLANKFETSKAKKEFVGGVNRILNDFGLEKKEFDLKISEDSFKEDLIIKLIKAFVKDLYKTKVGEVDFEKIGMGAQRLIVAALIRYYAEREIREEEKILIVFEEPEAYLHPKWKKSLYGALFKLSQRPGAKVLITTHDPYFIELGKGQAIYQIYRDDTKKDATAVKRMDGVGVLPYKSDGEINYLIFGVASESYYLELYEYLKRREEKSGRYTGDTYTDFDEYMFNAYFKSKKVGRICKADNKKDPITPITRLRHDIAHGIDVPVSIDLAEATEALISFIKAIK
ncbi:MAG: AAA family ATPase [bacterium]|nr:AAA family ATPase [bacterium]